MPHILLIEDNDDFRQVLQITLELLGHEVSSARDGKDALRMFASRPPDLIITDLVMPGKEGLETIQELKNLQPDVKIIAMSGGGRISPNHFLNVATILGANRTLAKPFTNEELVEAIQSVLAGQPRS